MIAEDLVARLDKAKRAGERSWLARCPAHADKGPSLKVTDADGKILIHCFAGCAPHEVVAAVGLKLEDLFPPRTEHERAVYRRERFGKTTLKELQHELQVALFVLRDVAEGLALDEVHHRQRSSQACNTITKLLRELGRST